MKLSQIAVNVDKETDGVWIDEMDGLRLKIARMGNAAYTNCLVKMGKPYARKIRSGNIDMKIMDDLTKQAVAKHVLLGWENLFEENGDAIAYSPAKALEIFRRPEFKEFYEMVIEHAQNAANFHAETFEDSEKNSATASAGS